MKREILNNGMIRRAATALLLCVLTTMTAWAETVETYYVDANGTRHSATATVLTGGGATTLAEGTYVVNSDIEYTGTITLTGDVILILGDGKTMTVDTSFGAMGIDGANNYKDLTIFGQTAQGGTLNVTTANGEGIGCAYIDVNSGTVNTTSNNHYAIAAGKVYINGGVVTATNYNRLPAIYGYSGVLINGGQVTAGGDDGVIATETSDCNITLGYTNADDFITFEKISTKGSVKIANGKVMTDGTNTYNDQTVSDVLKALTNKTLRPITYTVTFDSNGGSDVASQNVSQGMKATKPKPAPTRWGYVLSGWKLGEADYDFNSAVTSDLTLTASWREGEIVNYIDADGNEQTVTAAALTGNAEGGATLDDGWYVVNDDITYTGTINLGGDVNIILGDGKTMTVTNTGTRYDDYAIHGESKALHIYGQSQGTGELTATAVGGGNAIIIGADNGAGSLLGIHGGEITASTEYENGFGIGVTGATDAGGIIIDGGRVTASGNNSGIFCYGGHFDILGGQVTTTGTNLGGLGITDRSTNPGVLTLGCSKATDFISTNTIYNYSGQSREGEVKIATSQTLYDGTGASYNDQTESSVLAALTNVTLRNYDYRTVTFDSNGGSAVDAQILTSGGKATEPADPTREGCTFAGWTLNGADYDFDSAVTSNITLVAKWSVMTYYVDENGTRHDNVTASVLTGSETTLAAGTYLVNSDITYDHTLNLGNGEVNIILANGKTMSIGTEGSPIQEKGIDILDYSIYPALHIYGQTTDTDEAGSMEVYSTGIKVQQYTQHGGNVKSVTTSQTTTSIYATSDFTLNGGKLDVTSNERGILAGGGNLTINGGILNATTTATNSDFAAIYGGLDVTINSGQVTATATNGAKGIKSVNGDIILGYSRPTDFIEASSYSIKSGQKVKVKDGLKMKYDSETYKGDLTDNLSNIANKKLEPFSITYTVSFDANGGEGTMDPIVATFDQWTSIPSCTFTAPTGYAMKEWNRQADGSGDSFYAENGDFRNLASEQDAVVTLYAQWGKDIALCTADVPDPIYHPYSFHGYFYDGTWNDNHGNIKVYDGKTLLTYGTDYQYTTMESLDNGSCEELGEHCRVYLQGIGAYAGILYKDVVIAPATVTNAKWGSLTWNLDGDGKFTITGTGAMDAADNYYSYPWYNYGSYFTSITIGTDITTVAAAAFGGDNNTNPYGGVTTVDLPSTLTTIGENAFAYCTGATFNANNLIAKGVTIGEDAFNQVGCIEGTLSNNGDNTTMLSLMANARSANVTITGRTLYKDGNWNTICLPFDVKSDNSLLTDATVKELDLYGYYSEEGVYYSYATANLRRTGFDAENGTLYLYFKDATADSDDNLLKAGTPYLIKWPSGGTDITGDLTFEGVKVISSPQTLTSEDGHVSFRGTYASTTFNAENKSILLLGEANALYWPQSGAGIGACRAYFEMNGGANAVRSFVLNFGEETSSMHNAQFTMHNEAGAWYTLDGRKLDGKPTVKGVYIHGGRAVVVK